MAGDAVSTLALRQPVRLTWHRDPLRDTYAIASVTWVLLLAFGLIPAGGDAQIFYEHRFPTPYDVTDYASLDGFYYSPPVALLFAPLTALGVGPFSAVLTGAGLAALYGLVGRWAWLGLVFPPVWWDISFSNVNTILTWAALRGGSAWAIPLLTKVTPGLGMLWHLARGEWRALAWAAGATGAVVLASMVVAPQLWPAWIGSLTSNDAAGYAGPAFFAITIPLLPRLALAAGLLVIGARRDWRWTIPLALTLSMPVLWWIGFAPLVALPRLLTAPRRSLVDGRPGTGSGLRR